MSAHLRLTSLPRVLATAGYRDPPAYRTLYQRAIDGRFPAEQGANGHWTFDVGDVPAIALALDLTRDSTAQAA